MVFEGQTAAKPNFFGYWYLKDILLYFISFGFSHIFPLEVLHYFFLFLFYSELPMERDIIQYMYLQD